MFTLDFGSIKEQCPALVHYLEGPSSSGEAVAALSVMVTSVPPKGPAALSEIPLATDFDFEVVRRQTHRGGSRTGFVVKVSWPRVMGSATSDFAAELRAGSGNRQARVVSAPARVLLAP